MGSSLYLKSSSNSVDVKIMPKQGAEPTINTSTTVTSSASQADQGYTICLTASVSPASGSQLPTGDVVFALGQKKLGTVALSNGKAYLTIATLPAGSDEITASYAGNGNFAASASSAITVKITGPDFTVVATPAFVSATPGQSVTVSLLITPKYGFNQTPEMECSGMPAGATCSFAAPQKQADGASLVAMTINTSKSSADSRHPQISKAPLALALLPLVFWISSRRRREFNRLVSLSVLALGIVLLGGGAIGCGGRSTTGSTSAVENTVTITVTAKSTSGINHTTDVQLTLM
jgi:hypothetical protein